MRISRKRAAVLIGVVLGVSLFVGANCAVAAGGPPSKPSNIYLSFYPNGQHKLEVSCQQFDKGHATVNEPVPTKTCRARTYVTITQSKAGFKMVLNTKRYRHLTFSAGGTFYDRLRHGQPVESHDYAWNGKSLVRKTLEVCTGTPSHVTCHAQQFMDAFADLNLPRLGHPAYYNSTSP